MTTERIYSGTITVRPNGEDDNALWLDPTPEYDEPLAREIASDIDLLGELESEVGRWCYLSIKFGPKEV